MWKRGLTFEIKTVQSTFIIMYKYYIIEEWKKENCRVWQTELKREELLASIIARRYYKNTEFVFQIYFSWEWKRICY